MYKINPTKYAGVTVIPSEIARNHLKLSSLNQLKVIIFAYSKADTVFSDEEIAAATGIKKEEVADALFYWKEQGFLLTENEAPVIISTEAPAEKQEAMPVSEEKTVSVLPETKTQKIPANNPVKLNYTEICTRVAESESVRILLNEAQLRLGRTIGTGDQSSLILLHDYYGLPVEVILVICEFAATRGKSSNMNYIYKIGVDWSTREIDTLERADEELKLIEKVNSVWSSFASQVKLSSSHPTSAQEKYFSQWTNEWGFSVPMLVLAYEEMMANAEKPGFQYMHRILTSWHKKNIKTPEDAENEKIRFRKEQDEKLLNKSKRNKTEDKKELTPDPNASYDILRAEQRARQQVPKLKKRER